MREHVKRTGAFPYDVLAGASSVTPIEEAALRLAAQALRDDMGQGDTRREQGDGRSDPSDAEIVGMTIAKGPEFAKASLGLSRPGADEERTEGQSSSKWEQVARELVGRSGPGAPDPDREPER